MPRYQQGNDLFPSGATIGSNSTLDWDNGSGTSDVLLNRDAAGILALKNGNTAQEYRVYGGNGDCIAIKTAQELLTIAAGATSATTMQIPANSIVLGVAVRVTTVIPTAATFTVTGTTSATEFQTGTNVATSANTTDVGNKNCPYLNTAAQTVTITPNAQPANNTGRVRIVLHYLSFTAPTS